jgi:hypothetical protein
MGRATVAAEWVAGLLSSGFVFQQPAAVLERFRGMSVEQSFGCESRRREGSCTLASSQRNMQYALHIVK